MRRLICGPLMAFFLVQCATVTRGPMQSIDVDSEPAGASVQLRDCGVSSSASAKTPATVFVNRRATRCTLTFTLPEYGSRSVTLHRREWAWTHVSETLDAIICDDCESLVELVISSAFGAAIWGIGTGVDGMAGARYEQNQSSIFIDFSRPARNVTSTRDGPP